MVWLFQHSHYRFDWGPVDHTNELSVTNFRCRHITSTTKDFAPSDQFLCCSLVMVVGWERTGMVDPLPSLSGFWGWLVGLWYSICEPHWECLPCNQLGIFNTVVHPHKYRNSWSYIKICFKIGQGCQNLPLLNRLFILKSKHLYFDIVGSYEALKWQVTRSSSKQCTALIDWCKIALYE